MTREHRRSRRGEARPVIQPGEAWLRIKNPYPPIAQFSDDELEAIHLTSLNLLRDKGIKVLSAEAREHYREAGTEVNEDTLMVRFDSDMLLQTVGQAPPSFTMYGRSADRWLEVGENNLVFATVGGPPHYSDLENGRRAGTHDTFRDLLRMAQNYDVIHLTAPMVEPQDLPTPVRTSATRNSDTLFL